MFNVRYVGGVLKLSTFAKNIFSKTILAIMLLSPGLINAGSIEAAPSKPTYAPNHLIVKYKDTVTMSVREIVIQNKKFKDFTTDQSDSLDILHAKYKIKHARPLFHTEAEEIAIPGPKTLSALKRLHREKRKKIKQKFPVRAARSPKNNKAKDLTHVYVLEVDSTTNIEAAVSDFQNDPHVEYAEPDYQVHTTAIPDDPDFSLMWGLHNTGQTGGTSDADIDAPAAWDITTGSSNVIVGVIDTGVDYAHPDLNANIWVNTGETPNNGIDDDGNGYIDDIHGYDFINGDGDPTDDNGHGTHVSGTVAAVGNNGIGVTGVAWNARLMGLKFLGSDGSGWTSDAIPAITYARDMGVDILNNSWGSSEFSSALQDAISDASDVGILFVAAAGNDASDNDITPYYPSSYNLPNVLSVEATDENDGRAYFSSFGNNTVDLGAPGLTIYSTLPGNNYGYFSGTSMAAPHVSGSAALLLSQNPSRDAIGIKALLIEKTDPVINLSGTTVSGGRLNINNALSCDPTTPLVTQISPGKGFVAESDPTNITTVNPVSIQVVMHQCGLVLYGASITVSFDNGFDPLTLYDDGINGDGKAGDGIYGNSISFQNSTSGPIMLTAQAIHPTAGNASVNWSGSIKYADADADGISNVLELIIGTDPNNRDSDGDGVSDGVEICYDGDCSSYNPATDMNPLSSDTDGDGYNDSEELNLAGDPIDANILPWQEILLTNPTGSTYFGYKLFALKDIDSDGVRDFAAADKDSNGSGLVHLYSGASQQLIYTFTEPANASGFGNAVVSPGDLNNDGVNDIVIASQPSSENLNYELFVYSGINWPLLDRWSFTASLSSGINLVAMDTDLNGDQVPEIVVGEFIYVNVVSGIDGSILYGLDEAGRTGDGNSDIAIVDDVNGDAIPDIITGSPLSNSVYISSGVDGQLINQITSNSNYFGASVSNLGDFNNDGIPDFVVGAPKDLFDGVPGEAFVHSGKDGSQLYQWSGYSDVDRFGSTVSNFNLMDDLISDILVYARMEGSGTLYLYKGSTGALAAQFSLKAGRSPALITSGDLNGDGVDDIIYSDNSLIGASKIYVLLSRDTDSDGITDDLELSIGTDPNNPDSDGDGVSDGVEICYDGDCSSYNPATDMNPLSSDTDGDGYDDSEELNLAGDPIDASISPWQEILLTNPTGSSSFGYKLFALKDINGDGVRDFAAADKDSNGSGLVHLYSGASQQLIYTFTEPANASGFGNAVVSPGDLNNDGVNDIVIASKPSSANMNYELFVYSGINWPLLDRWSFTASYLPSDINLVAMDTDLNGDQIPEIVVGEFLVNIISGSDGSILHGLDNVYRGGRNSDIAIVDDVNGDTIPDIITGNTMSNSVYISSGADGQLIQQITRDPTSYFDFGASVSQAGDLNNDGVNDFIVGASGSDGSNDQGQVFAYSGQDYSEINTWLGYSTYSQFGFTVSSFNLMDDLISDILVYARMEGSGTLYLYKGSTGALAAQFSLKAYGSPALITLGDLNGDGVDDIIYSDNTYAVGASQIYVLLSPPTISDTDRDGIKDALELIIGTDPNNPDSDSDGISDGVEICYDGDCSSYNPATDMNPLSSDTDGDSVNDGDEIAAGTDPLDPLSFPIVADGDINGDGEVNSVDVLLGQQIISGQLTPTAEQLQRGDVAPLIGGVPLPDGQFNLADVLIIQRKVMGQINF